MLLLIKKLADVLIEQTRSCLLETVEFKLNKRMEFFSFSPTINFSEDGIWLLAVTSFDATKNVFKRTNENNSF